MAQTDLPTLASPERARKRQPNWKILLLITGLIGLSCLYAAVLAASMAGIVYFTFGPDRFSPKTKVYLTLDAPGKTAVPLPTVLQVMHTLDERGLAMGYKDVVIRRDLFARNRLIVTLPPEIEAQKYIDQVTAVGLVELVDFGKDSYAPGPLIRTDFEFPALPVSEGPVRHTVITNQQIEHASLRKEDQKTLVDFTVNPKGKELIKEYTTNHVGSYLAILLDRKILVVPKVSQPITEGSLEIEWIDPEEAKLLVAFLQTRPLPVKLQVEKVVEPAQ